MAALLVLLRILAHTPGIILAFTLHEFTKAAASHRLGDRSPQIKARLTLNPLKHIEPLGFLLLFFFRLGWGKPVETRSFAYKNRKRDELIVYILPALMNMLAGAVLALAWCLTPLTQDAGVWTGLLGAVLYEAAFVNISYALFNVIPIYPLDGYRVLTAVKPEWAMKIKMRERVAHMAILLLLCFGLLGQLFGGAAQSLLGLFNV